MKAAKMILYMETGEVFARKTDCGAGYNKAGHITVPLRGHKPDCQVWNVQEDIHDAVKEYEVTPGKTRTDALKRMHEQYGHPDTLKTISVLKCDANAAKEIADLEKQLMTEMKQLEEYNRPTTLNQLLSLPFQHVLRYFISAKFYIFFTTSI